MQTGDRHKRKHFQGNIVLWKTLQDGISEQEGFFPICAIVRYFCARLQVGERLVYERGFVYTELLISFVILFV